MPSKVQRLVKLYKNNISVYEKLTEAIKQTLTSIIEQENVQCALPVQARTKDIASFLEKAERKKYKIPFSEMTDITGSRIVLYSEDDARFIKDVVEDRFAIDMGKSVVDRKEKLSPSQFGYAGMNYVASLREDHPLLAEHPEFKDKLFEIQIMTLCQLSWEEMQRKIEYKAEDLVSTLISRRLSMLCAIFELADVEFQYLMQRGIEELLGQPITLRSLRIYSNKAKCVSKAISQGMKTGILSRSLPEEDLSYLDELYDACSGLGMKTLADLDVLLSKNELVLHLYTRIRKHHASIRAGPITLALLIIYHSNRKVDKTFLSKREWPKEAILFIIDRTKTARRGS
jgi:ppGpp synthetase/RelA/SpoT-type nucleotidyltranferase